MGFFWGLSGGSRGLICVVPNSRYFSHGSYGVNCWQPPSVHSCLSLKKTYFSYSHQTLRTLINTRTIWAFQEDPRRSAGAGAGAALRPVLPGPWPAGPALRLSAPFAVRFLFCFESLVLLELSFCLSKSGCVVALSVALSFGFVLLSLCNSSLPVVTVHVNQLYGV